MLGGEVFRRSSNWTVSETTTVNYGRVERLNTVINMTAQCSEKNTHSHFLLYFVKNV